MPGTGAGLRNASTSSGEGGRYKCRWSKDLERSCCGRGILGGRRWERMVVWMAGGKGGGDILSIVMIKLTLT